MVRLRPCSRTSRVVRRRCHHGTRQRLGIRTPSPTAPDAGRQGSRSRDGNRAGRWSVQGVRASRIRHVPRLDGRSGQAQPLARTSGHRRGRSESHARGTPARIGTRCAERSLRPHRRSRSFRFGHGSDPWRHASRRSRDRRPRGAWGSGANDPFRCLQPRQDPRSRTRGRPWSSPARTPRTRGIGNGRRSDESSGLGRSDGQRDPPGRRGIDADLRPCGSRWFGRRSIARHRPGTTRRSHQRRWVQGCGCCCRRRRSGRRAHDRFVERRAQRCGGRGR